MRIGAWIFVAVLLPVITVSPAVSPAAGQAAGEAAGQAAGQAAGEAAGQADGQADGQAAGEAAGQASGAEAAFLRRTALFRAEAGLGAVRPSEGLNREARRYAREMAERGVLSHRDQGGGRVLDRLTRAGYSAAAAGEVLGFGPGTREIFDAWMESPSHRRVLAGGRWNRCGAGAWVTAEGVLTAAVILAEKREVPHGRE